VGGCEREKREKRKREKEEEEEEEEEEKISQLSIYLPSCLIYKYKCTIQYNTYSQE